VDRIHRVISPQSAANEKAIMMIVKPHGDRDHLGKRQHLQRSIVAQDRQAAQRAQPFALKTLRRRSAV
jgi:hypothetical protein